MDGILLAYSNIKLTQRNAVLLYDDVDMHMDVRYDAVIFRVVPGSLLKVGQLVKFAETLYVFLLSHIQF